MRRPLRNIGASLRARLLNLAKGLLTVDIAKFPSSFAADVDPETTRFMVASQVRWGMAAVNTKITQAAWKTKRTYFLVTTEDHMIPTPQQQETACALTPSRSLQ